MIPELDPKIIHDFRKKVNENNDFIRLYFEDYKAKNNIEGKDIWSKICSCMDWLTVSVEGIEKPEKSSNMNISSLKFTHFLVTIDMVVEAVNHLWLAIGQVNKVEQPYINDRSIFNGREFDRDYTDESILRRYALGLVFMLSMVIKLNLKVLIWKFVFSVVGKCSFSHTGMQRYCCLVWLLDHLFILA